MKSHAQSSLRNVQRSKEHLLHCSAHSTCPRPKRKWELKLLKATVAKTVEMPVPLNSRKIRPYFRGGDGAPTPTQDYPGDLSNFFGLTLGACLAAALACCLACSKASLVLTKSSKTSNCKSPQHTAILRSASNPVNCSLVS